MEQIDWRIVIAAIVGITVIEISALFNGIDGTYLTVALSILALIAGVAIPKNIIKI